MTELILIRHGVTAGTGSDASRARSTFRSTTRATGRRAGSAAALAGEPLGAIYASDLSRAWHTARPLAETLGLGPTPEPRLRERFYGAFEAAPSTSCSATRPRTSRAGAPGIPTSRFRAGARRCVRCTHGWRAAAGARAQAPGERIAAVTHGGVLDCAYRVATGLGLSEPRHHDLLNASVNRIAFDGEGFRLVSWGEVEHLRRADDAIEGD